MSPQVRCQRSLLLPHNQGNISLKEFPLAQQTISTKAYKFHSFVSYISSSLLLTLLVKKCILTPERFPEAQTYELQLQSQRVHQVKFCH